ncbi:MAG: RNA polymerase sigma factor [Vicinamibacterales bacterium]
MTNPEHVHLSTNDPVRAAYAELVRGAAAGDDSAMERLLMRAQEVAYRFSLLVCGHPEDAEDVMQDALMKTYQYVSRIQAPDAFRTWLYRTVRNACLMKRRRRVDEPAHHVSIEQGGFSEEGEPQAVAVEAKARPADQQLMDAWIGARLRKALTALPPAYRAIVVMREIEGLSTREVAGIMRISEANVKTRLHRARVMMRQQLGDAVGSGAGESRR